MIQAIRNAIQENGKQWFYTEDIGCVPYFGFQLCKSATIL